MKKLLSRALAIALAVVMAIPAFAQTDATARKRIMTPEPTVVEDFVGETLDMPASMVNNLKVVRPHVNGTMLTHPTKRLTPSANGMQFAPEYAPLQDYFYGTLVYYTGISAYGMYEFSSQNPLNYTLLGTNNAALGASAGGAYLDGKFYCTDLTTNDNNQITAITSYVLDATTWQTLQTVTQGMYYNNLSVCYSYDPITNGIIAFNYAGDGKGYALYTLNTADFSYTLITNVTNFDSTLNPNALGIASDGTIYLMCGDGEFGKIDRATGAFSLIKATGLSTYYITSGTMDTASNTFFWATSNSDGGKLYAVDTTGNSSLVCTFQNDEEFGAMYFMPFVEKADPKAPAAPTIESLTFEGTSLKGTIAFTIPSTLFDGSKGSGDIRFELLANGEVIAQSKSIDWGHSYRFNIAVPTDGLYDFELICYNEAGASPAAKKTLYVGWDDPAAPQNVKAAYADGKMTITWNPVTTGANNATIGENITYAVYDAATGECLAEALTECTYTLDIEDPIALTDYSYYVIATADGRASEPAYSNTITLGPLPLPYSNTLVSTTGSLTDWTVISVSGSTTWSISNTNYGTRLPSVRNAVQDDWLISPCFYMEKGKYYVLSFRAKTYNSGTTAPVRSLRVAMGNEPTVAAMTKELKASTQITSTSWTTYTIGIEAEESGYAYIGFEGMIPSASSSTTRYLCIDSFKLAAGINAHAPAAATDLNVLARYDGTPSASLTYKNPTVTYLNEPLEGAYALTRVEVYANDELINVNNEPVAGGISFVTYNAPYSGQYTFKVVAFNETGEGTPATITTYLGVNIPAAPASATVESLRDGKVNISWTPVTTDVDGNMMNPDFITYAVVDVSTDDLKLVAEGITATEVNDYMAVPNGQAFVQFAILAESEAGTSDPTYTDVIAAGKPYTTPMLENFANGRLNYIWDIAVSSAESGFFLLTDADVTGIASHNDDNGLLWFQVGESEYNKPGYLYSGEIEVTQEGSVVEFYTFSTDANDPNTVGLYITCDGVRTSAGTAKKVNAGPVGEWYRQSFDISQYYGKVIELEFVLTTGRYRASILGAYTYYRFIALDDIRVGKPVMKDLVAESISVPATVSAEKAFNVTYTIKNNGLEAVEADSYGVNVYCRGNLLESEVATPAIAAGASYTGTVEVPAFSIFETGTYMFNYVITYEGDENTSNNASQIARAKVVAPELPAIELEGEFDSETAAVELSWDAPVIDVTQSTIEDSFESASYPAFATSSFGDWTIVNYNTSATYGFGGTSFPGSGSSFGWILFDTQLATTSDGSPSGIQAYEGSCMMGAFAHNSGANDAWLISPAIDATGQTISFMARAQDASYNKETFEVYYSTGSMNTADFIKIAEDQVTDTEVWKKFSYTLPAGATRFAIRSTAEDQFVLWVDCVTFESSSPFTNLELQGYEVYRNNELIATVPMSQTKYTDTLTEEGTYKYTVACLYNEGHSGFSNVYTVKYVADGLAAVEAASRVSVEHNQITVTGAKNVTIASADGKLIYNGEGLNVKVNVGAGIYVVRTNDRTQKVIVK